MTELKPMTESESRKRLERLIYPALVWGSVYESVPFAEAISRPRYRHLAEAILKFSEAFLPLEEVAERAGMEQEKRLVRSVEEER